MKDQIEMVTCVSCGILFPSSFLLNAEGGAVAIGTDCYCSQACAEGQVVRPLRYMVFDEFDFMRGDRWSLPLSTSHIRGDAIQDVLSLERSVLSSLIEESEATMNYTWSKREVYIKKMPEPNPLTHVPLVVRPLKLPRHTYTQVSLVLYTQEAYNIVKCYWFGKSKHRLFLLKRNFE